MTDAEILPMKLNLSDCASEEKGKEEFFAKIFMMYLVLEMK